MPEKGKYGITTGPHAHFKILKDAGREGGREAHPRHPAKPPPKKFLYFSLAKDLLLWYHHLSNFEEDFNMPRELAILACTECKRRNYTTTRNKRTQTNRVEMKKYCPTERKRTLHKEVK